MWGLFGQESEEVRMIETQTEMRMGMIGMTAMEIGLLTAIGQEKNVEETKRRRRRKNMMIMKKKKTSFHHLFLVLYACMI